MRRGREDQFPDNGFEAWGGYMNAKIAKLEEQFIDKCAQDENKTSNIFSGISIFVNGYTKPSADELKCLMSEHGGVYHHYFRSNRTSFIIASNLCDTKVKNLPTTKILKPEWITDSIQAGSLLDYKEYLLYSNHSRTQPRLHFKANTTLGNVKTTEKSSPDLDDTDQEDTTALKDIPIVEITTVNNDLPTTIKTDNLSNKEAENKNIEDCSLKSTSSDSKLTSNANAKQNAASRTAVDPKFLSEFYNNSRLHHISQLGAGFKQYVNELRSNHSQEFPMRESLKKEKKATADVEELGTDKVIMHIDMDCFFVSVGLRNKPELKGQPVAVTHAKNSGGQGRMSKREGVNRLEEFNMYKQRKRNKLRNKGKPAMEDFDDDQEMVTRVDGLADEDEKYGSMSEIASCSYEARALGLRNGMFMGPALRLCPNLKTIPYDFEGYKEVAYALYNTVAQYTLDIEAVSCDEMYVDCTELLRDVGLPPLQFASHIREEIRKKTHCPCSTGFGENRLQARLATKTAKPDGQFYLRKCDVESYFSEIQLSELPGVGCQMQYKLSSLGYTTCGSIQSAALNTLQKHFGAKTGELLYNYCRGNDLRPLNFTILRKSISAGVNYGIRFEDAAQCETFFKQLCEEVSSRMNQNKLLGRCVTLKLMVRAHDAPVETAKFMGHGICDNVTRTSNLTLPTDNADVIFREVSDICRKMNVKPEEMRGIGIQVTKLESKDKIGTKGGIKNFLRSKDIIVQEESSIKNNIENETQVKSPVLPAELKTTNLESKKIEVRLPELTDVPKTKSSTVPVVNKTKSLGLTGRRRGRPPKHLSSANRKITPANKNQSIKEKFTHRNSSNDRQTNQFQYNLEDVDVEFLNALPDDIREEILANCKKSTSPPKSLIPAKQKTTESTQLEPSKDATVSSESRNLSSTCSSEMKSEEKVGMTLENSFSRSSSSDILDIHWKQMREILREWFQSTRKPLHCDVSVIVSYVENLVTLRKIEDLHCLVNFIYRTASNQGSCEWHSVYNKAIEHIQQAMLIIYGSKISANTKFTCCDT